MNSASPPPPDARAPRDELRRRVHRCVEFVRRVGPLALPLATVLVVAYGVLVAGAARPITGARIYGGPTEGITRLALRIQTVIRDGEGEAYPWLGPLAVRAVSATGVVSDAVVSDAVAGVGEAELAFSSPVKGPLALQVRDARGSLLADHDIMLTRTSWAARARRRGGWIRGRAGGGLIVSIAPGRGAFVVGFADPLWIRVERAGKPVPGARVAVVAEGALLGTPRKLLTDDGGLARVSYSPQNFDPTLRAEAKTDDGASGSIESVVPVVPGGFHTRRLAAGQRIEIAVPRSEVFYSWVTEHERVSGGVLALTPDGNGGVFGLAPLVKTPQPAWLVLSSDVDLNSSAAIGWPLDSGAEPARTFDVPDALLLDGLPAAFVRESARRSRVRWLIAGFVALALALSAVLLVVRVRAAERDIARHFRENLGAESVPLLAPRHGLSLLVAVLAVALGFVLLGLIAAARVS